MFFLLPSVCSSFLSFRLLPHNKTIPTRNVTGKMNDGKEVTCALPTESLKVYNSASSLFYVSPHAERVCLGDMISMLNIST